jgi:hypothetical protein
MRLTIATAVLALGTAFAMPALAHGKHGGGAKFPVAAAEFKQKIDGKMTKARARMEERAAKLPAGEAKALRAKFDTGLVKVNAEVARATADGTVTKDEAKAVWQVAREVRGAKGKHGGGHGKSK